MLYLLTGYRGAGKTRWLEGVVHVCTACGVPVYGVVAPGVWRVVPADARPVRAMGQAAGTAERAACAAERVAGVTERAVGVTEREADAAVRDARAAGRAALPIQDGAPVLAGGAGHPGWGEAPAPDAEARAGAARSGGGAAFEKIGIDNVLYPGRERVHLACRRDLARAAGALDADSQSERAGLGWAMDDAALARVDAHLASLDARYVSGAPSVGGAPAPAHLGLLVIDELGPLELVRGGGLRHAVTLVERGAVSAWGTAVAVVRPELLSRAHECFDAAWDGAVRELAPTVAARDEVCAALGIDAASVD